MTPEATRELKQLALRLAGLNAQAGDLAGSCAVHRGAVMSVECEGCAPLLRVLEQIGETQQRYHFARHAADWSDTARGLAAKEVEPETAPWWRRWLRWPGK